MASASLCPETRRLDAGVAVHERGTPGLGWRSAVAARLVQRSTNFLPSDWSPQQPHQPREGGPPMIVDIYPPDSGFLSTLMASRLDQEPGVKLPWPV
jgi:hypothetical protein